ncbi:MAG TPA: hypothetical protein VF665_14550 [Longimicrobium sp.]|jgi:hypothetical protein
MAISKSEPAIIDPTWPTEPTGCPTCLSGTPPRDPWFEGTIEPAPAAEA